MEKADLKSPKVFSEDLDLNSPSFSMEPSMKRRKKHFKKDGLTNHSAGQTTDIDHNALEHLSGFILSQTNVKSVQ